MRHAMTLSLLISLGCLNGQQVTQSRILLVAVTDPGNRFVTGLTEDQLEVVEGGIRRNITTFAGPDSPVAIAVVGAGPSARDLAESSDEWIQSGSAEDALRQLASSARPRRALILTGGATTPANVPPGILILSVERDQLRKAVVEARNRYLIGFQSSNSGSAAQVNVKPPVGLPTLKAVSN